MKVLVVWVFWIFFGFWFLEYVLGDVGEMELYDFLRGFVVWCENKIFDVVLCYISCE